MFLHITRKLLKTINKYMQAAKKCIIVCFKKDKHEVGGQLSGNKVYDVILTLSSTSATKYTALMSKYMTLA